MSSLYWQPGAQRGDNAAQMAAEQECRHPSIHTALMLIICRLRSQRQHSNCRTSGQQLPGHGTRWRMGQYIDCALSRVASCQHSIHQQHVAGSYVGRQLLVHQLLLHALAARHRAEVLGGSAPHEGRADLALVRPVLLPALLHAMRCGGAAGCQQCAGPGPGHVAGRKAVVPGEWQACAQHSTKYRAGMLDASPYSNHIQAAGRLTWIGTCGFAGLDQG